MDEAFVELSRVLRDPDVPRWARRLCVIVLGIFGPVVICWEILACAWFLLLDYTADLVELWE